MKSQIAEKLFIYNFTMNMQKRNTNIQSRISHFHLEDRKALKSIVETLIDSRSTSCDPHQTNNLEIVQQTPNHLLESTAKRLKFHLLQTTLHQLIVDRLQKGLQLILSTSKSLEVPCMRPHCLHHFNEAIQTKSSRNLMGGIQQDLVNQIEEISNENHENNSKKQQLLFFPQNSLKFQYNVKTLQRELFMANLQRANLKTKVKGLQTQLMEVVKRQQKQLSKKSDSLKGLIEQLSEKNETIDELKASVKTLEGRLHAQDKGILNIILEEDSQLLKKVVFRLEHINDKLNTDLQKMKAQKSIVQLKNKQLLADNEKLKQSIHNFKQQLFEIQMARNVLEDDKRELQITSQRMNSRLDKIRKVDKKLTQISKSKDSISTNIQEGNNSNSFKSQKKTHESQLYPRTQSVKDIEADNKLQAIFTYLFHIQDQSNELQFPELFDQDQKDLLAIHKEKFNSKLFNHNNQKIRERNHPDVQKCLDGFIQSLDQAFNEAQLEKAKFQEEIKRKTNKKLLSLQLERTNMIEKISELKQKQLHLRSIIFTFLKSLELKSLKRNTESICQILFDFFEYSEQQKMAIFQVKSKRFFGIL